MRIKVISNPNREEFEKEVNDAINNSQNDWKIMGGMQVTTNFHKAGELERGTPMYHIMLYCTHYIEPNHA